MMRSISDKMIEELMLQAALSERKRAIYRLHEHEEPVQRMVNALIPGTYVRPHKHENPDKTELFAILTGNLVVFHFTQDGQVEDIIHLGNDSGIRIVDIPAGIYHCLIALEPSATLEIIQGPYEAATHKQFAPWAPPEDVPASHDYLAKLENIARRWQIEDGAQ